MSLQPDPGNEPRPTGLVIFDRDGVLHAVFFDGTPVRGPWALSELALLPGVERAVAAVTDAGLTVVVATNQPDIARLHISHETVSLINQRINERIPGIARFYVCGHDNSDGCRCRKPSAGMLMDALAEFGADPTQTWMVGDRWTDIAAGRAADVRTVLIEDEFSWRPTSQGPPPAGLRPDAVVASTEQAVEVILRAQDNR